MNQSIEALARQFHGRAFRDLVLEHARQPAAQLTAALEGTLEQLPDLLLDRAPALMGKAEALAAKPSFWAEDAGRVLLFLTSRMRSELHDAGARTDDAVLLTLFNALVINFARHAGDYPLMLDDGDELTSRLPH